MAFSAADPNALESSLRLHVFLTADYPTSLDAKVFEELGLQIPDGLAHPYLYAWYLLISQFSTKAKDAWPQFSAEDEVDLFAEDSNVAEEAKQLAAAKASAHT